MTPTLWTIGDLAERAGVSTSAIRYYERRGLIEPTTRVAGQRRYSTFAIQRLTAILLCQQAGFTLDEIATMLDAPDTERVALAEAKLTELDRTIERLRHAQRWVRGILACGCASLDGCSVVEHLDPKALR